LTQPAQDLYHHLYHPGRDRGARPTGFLRLMQASDAIIGGHFNGHFKEH
jgi:hypothetical protein